MTLSSEITPNRIRDLTRKLSKTFKDVRDRDGTVYLTMAMIPHRCGEWSLLDSDLLHVITGMKIMLPVTVTKSVTNQELSVAVESCDAAMCLGSFREGGFQASICVP
jgi:hypothetical protein